MPTWILEPRDPLIVRDGRPFGPAPGARAVSLAFPFPSTITGGVRALAGVDDAGVFDAQRISALQGIAVRGPLLVELEEDADEIADWLAPAPADVLLFADQSKASDKVERRRLVPLSLPDGTSSNLPSSLAPVGLAPPESRKPLGLAPRFWRWSAFEAWLVQPDEVEGTLDSFGGAAPVRERRMHVGLNHETNTGIKGALFQTSGLEFTTPDRRRLALGLVADTPFPRTPGWLAPLGGERRLMRWFPSGRTLPACPPQVRAAVVAQGACRLILLTPACFANGFQPAELLTEHGGVKPFLAAAAVPRAQVISGWDLATKQPKPTRRLVPAGSVFFLTLRGEAPAIERWVDDHWMACISDGQQDRLDGFGLAVLGTWSGQLTDMA